MICINSDATRKEPYLALDADFGIGPDRDFGGVARKQETLGKHMFHYGARWLDIAGSCSVFLCVRWCGL